MYFAQRLKEVRKKRKVTQQELGDVLGIGRSAIAGYETQGKQPDYNKLKLISQYLNVSLDYLIGSEYVEPKEGSEQDSDNLTIATHRINYGEDLPEEALNEIEEYVKFLKFKYSQNTVEEVEL